MAFQLETRRMHWYADSIHMPDFSIILLQLMDVFLFSLQARAPSKVSSMFSGTQDKCVRCNKTAYPLEKVYKYIPILFLWINM